MLHRTIRFAYVVIALFSVAMAFMVMRNFDEMTVTGPSSVVRINQSDDVATGQQVTSMVEAFAREHRVNIGRVADDLEHPENVRHLYVAVGDPHAESAHWLDEGYPGFSPGVRTEVHPLRDVSERDPRAYYLVFGPPAVADELLAGFSAQGLQGSQYPFFTLARAFEFFGNGALLWCALIVGLVIVVVVASGVVLSTRAYGVQRLHGHSFGKILGRDMRSVLAHLLGVGAILVPVTVLLLAAYNGLNQLATFALVAAGFFLALTALAIGVHLLALVLVHRAGILASLKGEVSARTVMSASYVIRIPALFLAFAATASLAFAADQAVAQRAEMAEWSQAGDAVYVLLNGSLGRESGELGSRAGGWIRRSAAEGEVILSQQEMPDYFVPPGSDSPVRDVLVVNSSYLSEQSVVDPDGRRLTGPAVHDHAVRVLIPERYWSESAGITGRVGDWATFLIGERPVAPPTLQPTRMGDGQALFTYNSERDLRLQDPVVVVLPDGSDVLPDDQYMAYATQGGIVFRDGEYALASVSDQGLSSYVLAVNPVIQKAANQYRNAVRELNLRTFNVVACLAVLAITAISVAVVYCRKNSQVLFVKHISGWSFARAYRPILLLEAAVSLLLVAVTLLAALARSGSATDPRLPPSEQVEPALGGWEPVAAGAIAVLSMVFVVAALARFNRRLIRERAAEV